MTKNIYEVEYRTHNGIESRIIGAKSKDEAFKIIISVYNINGRVLLGLSDY